jgi:hypothetical protein
VAAVGVTAYPVCPVWYAAAPAVLKFRYKYYDDDDDDDDDDNNNNNNNNINIKLDNVYC